MTARVYDSLPKEAEDIRRAVFMDEQGFKDEFDETDMTARHIVIFDGSTAAATCRVFCSEQHGRYVLGRLAVLKQYRGQQLGSMAVAEAEKLVRSMGGRSIMLHAQCRASGFYGRLGYEQFGCIDYDEGCEHIWMKKEL